MKATPATPMISASRPPRTIQTGATLPLSAPAMPLATNEPIASESSHRPVCRASKPTTNCSHRGRARMMPNSPSETTAAAMLPLRNDVMRNRPKASRVERPARWRRRPHAMKAMSATSATAKAIGTGESESGHVQSPIAGAVSTVHHP